MLPDHLIERITIDAVRLAHKEKYQSTLEIIKNMVKHYYSFGVHLCHLIRDYRIYYPRVTPRRWINSGKEIPFLGSLEFMEGSIPRNTRLTAFCTNCGEYEDATTHIPSYYWEYNQW